MDTYTIISLVMAILTVLLGILSIIFRISNRIVHEDISGDIHYDVSRHLDDRIESVSRELERLKNSKKQNREIYLFLVAIELGVGACLVSTFFNLTFGENFISVSGVVVLLATIIHEIFHPDQKYKEDDKKYRALYKVFQEVKDKLNTNPDVEKGPLITKLSAALHKSVS